VAEPRTFRYFLARGTGRPPRWIRLGQWAALALWLAFSYWIFAGRGGRLLEGTYVLYHGVFADQVALRVGVLPNWGLVTLALAALVVWFQALWRRCRVEVTSGPPGWVWAGRRGPCEPERAVITPGGAWLAERGRWFMVPKGFVDPEGRDWLLAAGVTRIPVLHWRALASPLSLVLIGLVCGVYLIQAPARSHRQTRISVYRAVESRSPALQGILHEHPDFRPWARYLSCLKACDKPPCLRSQIADRIEMRSIGPHFGGDEATLYGLLVITGKTDLVFGVMEPTPRQAFDIAVRLRRPYEARSILAAHPEIRKRQNGEDILLLLEEGRFSEAEEQMASRPPEENLANVAQRATVAYLSGNCDEARAWAFKLLAPASLVQARLEGEAPPTGLGALQRAVREVKYRAVSALGLAVLGSLKDAVPEWSEAERLAEASGVPGALDRERILLDLVAPGPPWGVPSSLPPAK
jgi:hypothetical protein